MRNKCLIYILIIIISIFMGIITRIQLTNLYSLNSDMIEHYYHMRKYYDNKIIPVTGALLEGGAYIGDPYDNSSEAYSSKIANLLLITPYDNRANVADSILEKMSEEEFCNHCYSKPKFSRKTPFVPESDNYTDDDYRISTEDLERQR